MNFSRRPLASHARFHRSASRFAISAALTLGAGAALAQEQAGEEEAADVIVVSGFRASLESAVAEKKQADLIVESISAEDIGKLPDASIAESIARLPGLTSQRVSGRSNAISIRGFAPDFSTTLLNGREQTSTGDNRAVEYDQYPSEVISRVNVYKTPTASLVGQGLSGTVDLQTVRPLDFGKQAVTVGARGNYVDIGKLNTGSREYGYRVYATYIDQFADDTLGIALSASYLDEPYQIQEFNAWGYAGNGSAATPFVIGGSKSFATSTDLTRLGLQGTIEWQPAPEFTTTFDAFYSDFKDDQIKRGVELPLGFFGLPLSNVTVVDGFVTAGTFTGVEGVVRNDVFERKAKLYSFGWNGKYEGDNGWSAMLDLSFSKTDRNELVFESNAGTGRGQGVGAVDTISFVSSGRGTVFDPTLNYGDYNTILLTSPLGWGGTQIGVNGDSILNGQDGYYNDRIIEDELRQYRVEVEKAFDGSFISAVKVGLNYTDRSKSLTPDEAFVGLVANTDGLTSVPVPADIRLKPTDLTYLGLGPVISYDPRKLLEAGVYKLVPNPYGDVVVKAYDVEEKLMTAYIQADIKATLGASELTGNVGVQFISTDQNSRGATATFLGTNPNGSPNIGATARNESTDYIDVLPSLNLSLRLPSDFVVRLGAAREIIRPRLDDMRASLSYGYTIVDPDGPLGPQPPTAVLSGSSGNPDLRPWRANAVDLTLEKYFGSKGYVALQLFYKDLKSYIYNQDFIVNTADFVLSPPATGVAIAPVGVLNIPINGEGGELYGVELAGTLPFATFSEALDGFGITGGASYTKTKIEPTPGAPAEDIPGYSKWVVNGTAYFEKWGFNARGSIRYRSTFVGEVSGFGAARTRRRAEGELIVDAQIGYDFQEGSALSGLSLYLQGQNLTNEPFVTHAPDDSRQIIDHQRYGRRYMLGASYKF
jgi:iron complex outermembrane receptor protein